MLTLLALALAPQFPDFEERHRTLPATFAPTYGSLLVDIDDDGDLDLLRADASAGLIATVALNDGAGSFELETLVGGGGFGSDVALGELNGDGLDYVAVAGGSQVNSNGSQAGRDQLFVGLGGPPFLEVQGAFGFDQHRSTAIELVDMDSDGDLDIVVARIDEPNAYYRNDGGQNYVELTFPGEKVGDTRELLVIDLELDGDPDLVYVNADTPHEVYRNDPPGVFSEVPSLLAAVPSTTAGALGDLDGDGDVDLVFPAGVALRTGPSSFAPGPGQAPGALHELELGDLDGDGDLDAVSPDDAFNPDSGVWLNDGSGSFTHVGGGLNVLTAEVWDAALGDIDGDGDLDVVLGRGEVVSFTATVDTRDAVFLNNGSGQFTDVTGFAPSLPDLLDQANDVDLFDMDGDGDLDAAVSVFFGVPGGAFAPMLNLYRNTGGGVFEDASGGVPNTSGFAASLTAGDFDGDGDIDLVTNGLSDDDGGGGGLIRYLNDGTGDFSDVQGIGGELAGTDVESADLDGDGDLDLIAGTLAVSTPPIGSPLYLQRPDGSFDIDITQFDDPPMAVRDLELGDLDGDGLVDVYFGNAFLNGPFGFATSDDRVYLNQGGGSFALKGDALAFDPLPTLSVAIGDVDADGDLDVFADSDNGVDLLLVNDGSASFTISPIPFALGVALNSGQSRFIDLDLDGDLDLFGVGEARVLENVGGTLVPMPGSPFPDGSFGSAVDFDDVDGDGDLDAFLAAAGEIGAGVFSTGARGPDRLLTNRSRHLAWSRVPSIGKPFTLETCADAPSTAFLWLSLGRAQLPLGFGTLWIDPLSAVQIDTYAVADCVERSYPLPANPNLLGLETYLQAAVASGTDVWLSGLEVLPFTDL